MREVTEPLTHSTMNQDYSAAKTLADYLSTVTVPDLRWSCPMSAPMLTTCVYEPSPGLAVRGPMTTLAVLVPGILQRGLSLSQLRRLCPESMRTLAKELKTDAAQFAALMTIRSDEASDAPLFEGPARMSFTGTTAAVRSSDGTAMILCKKCTPLEFEAAHVPSPCTTPLVPSPPRPTESAAPHRNTRNEEDGSRTAVEPAHYSAPPPLLWVNSGTLQFMQPFADSERNIDWQALLLMLSATEATTAQRSVAQQWWNTVAPSPTTRKTSARTPTSVTLTALCSALDKGATEAANRVFTKYTRSSPWYAIASELQLKGSITPLQDISFQRSFVGSNVLTRDGLVRSWLADPQLMIPFFPFFVNAAPNDRLTAITVVMRVRRSYSRKRSPAVQL